MKPNFYKILTDCIETGTAPRARSATHQSRSQNQNFDNTAGAVAQEQLVSPLEHGTEAEHRATLARAKAGGLTYVGSGDVRRNRYLAENLRFGEEAGIRTTKWVESDQESGWEISWANVKNQAP